MKLVSKLLIVLMMVLGFHTAESFANETVERAKVDGIQYGLSNEPPYAYVDSEGKPAGTNAEMIVAIFERMGVRDVRPVLTEWASLIPGLKVGRFDVATSMFILPKRCEEVAFAEPLTRTVSAMLVKKGNPKTIHSYESVASNDDATLAVMAGAAEHGFARKAGIPEERILPVQDPGAMLAAVKAGRADAAALTPPSIKEMAEKGGDEVEKADPFSTPEWAISYSAPPFRKEDSALLDAFNSARDEFIGSPQYAEIIERVGSVDEMHPGDMTADEQCNK